LASNLNEFVKNEVEKGRLQQAQKAIDRERSQLDWGIPLHKLPIIEWDEYLARCKEGQRLICITGIVHDVTRFVDRHPGGKTMIMYGVGKDATAMFNGSVYK
jgi:stearoyl-CoA desaturase (delta-9 desaturase)